jgi:hypothetical protein
MHVWNAARVLLLAEMLIVPGATFAQAQRGDQEMQFCWSLGRFDQTVYFAESSQLDDRSASFTEMLDISAIDHNLVECRYLNPDQRIAILRSWSDARLEAINTTFLSDLDY